MLVTHQIQFTRLCDHVYLMSDGTLASQGPCQDILTYENRSGFPEQDDIRVRLVFNVLVNGYFLRNRHIVTENKMKIVCILWIQLC